MSIIFTHKTLIRVLPGLVCLTLFSLTNLQAEPLLDGDGQPWHCPQEHIYIQCGELHDNLDYYGYPTPAYGYKKDVHIHGPYVDKYLDKCGRGKIIRKWKIKYHYEWYWCEQTIHIKDGYGGAFDGKSVYWPKDYHLKNCEGNMHPDYLPYGYNWPEFKHKGCSQLGLRYEDKVYPYHGGYTKSGYGYDHHQPCKVVYRTWELIDWCQYDSHYGKSGYGYEQKGRWTYVQKIFIYDDEAPVIESCPEDIEADGGDCKGGKTYVEIPKVEASDNCGKVIYGYSRKHLGEDAYHSSYTGGNVFYDGNDASGYYEPGKTLVTYKVIDYCGNTTTCEFIVNVTAVDKKAPTVIAISSLTAVLMQRDTNDGTIELWPSEFNVSSSDNCTAPEDLEFSLEPAVFTCADYGVNEVKFTVTDEAGNSDYVMVEVVVQANSFECIGGNISGKVMASGGLGVENVEVTLMEGMQKMTNDQGDYSFDQIPLGRTLHVSAYKDDDVTQGIDMYDYTLLSMHLDGVRLLRDPHELIAADIDGNKVIDQEDLQALQRLILGIDKRIASNTAWKFIPLDYEFPDTVSPLLVELPEQFSIRPYNGGEMHVDFRAIKVGDIGAQSSTEESGEERGTRTMVAADQLVEPAAIMTVPFRFQEKTTANALSFSFDMDIDGMELVGFEDGALSTRGKLDLLVDSDVPSSLIGSWFSLEEQTFEPGEVLFAIKVKGKRSRSVSQLLHLDRTAGATEVMGESEGKHSIRLVYEGQVDPSLGLQLFQNSPNPVRDETVIGFFLPEAGEAELEITDTHGRLLMQRTGHYSSGYQQLSLQLAELPASGLLFYRLRHGNNELVKKMILLP